MASSYIEANILRLFKERGVKESHVAKLLGMSRSTFCSMLHGRKLIRAEYLPVIIEALNCTYDDLFRKPEGM